MFINKKVIYEQGPRFIYFYNHYFLHDQTQFPIRNYFFFHNFLFKMNFMHYSFNPLLTGG